MATADLPDPRRPAWASSTPPERDRSVDARSARIEPRLRLVVERDYGDLAALCCSLNEAGPAPDVIRSCARDLLASCGAQLAQSLTKEAAP